MTDSYGPFDSAPWADQTQWYRHAPKWAPSGVNGAPATSSTTGDLALSFSGLSPTIGTGRAWVRGSGFERTAPSGLPALPSGVPVNTNASLSRRDRIVLRRDLAAKTVAPTLIQGTPSASPTAPSIQQNETGQWDRPLFSFLVPPNSGTSITGIVDERAWANGGPVVVPSIAVRDANFPSPTGGEQCQCLSPKTLMTHDGTKWRFTLSGTTSYTVTATDANGFMSFPHGGGQAPIAWVIVPGYQIDDSTNKLVSILSSSNAGDAVNLGCRVARNDGTGYIANFGISVNWTAQF